MYSASSLLRERWQLSSFTQENNHRHLINYSRHKQNRQTELKQTVFIWLTIDGTQTDRQKQTDWNLQQWLLTNFTRVFHPIYTITAELTIHFERTRPITTSTDKHCSLDSETDFSWVDETSVSKNSSFQKYPQPQPTITTLLTWDCWMTLSTGRVPAGSRFMAPRKSS